MRMKKIMILFLAILYVNMLTGCGGQAEQRHKDSADSGVEFQKDTYELNNPTISEDNITTWDTIYFGNYWQNDTNGDAVANENDDKEPIRWRVLSVEGDDAFLLADKNLDCKRYNDTKESVTWETCTLRRWLNDDFFMQAFTAEEQAAVKKVTVVNKDNEGAGTEGEADTEDYVYILSYEEVGNSTYGFLSDHEVESPAREVGNTDYAEVQGAWIATYVGHEGSSHWWLRSLGTSSDVASVVSSFGIVGIDSGNVDVNHRTVGVRPVLHLNLSSASEWSYAGKVTSEERTMSVWSEEWKKEEDDLGIISTLADALSAAVADVHAMDVVTITIGADASALSHASPSGKEAQKVLDIMVEIMGDPEIKLSSSVGSGQEIICYCDPSNFELVVYVARHNDSVGGDEVSTCNGVVVQNCIKYNNNAPLMASN